MLEVGGADGPDSAGGELLHPAPVSPITPAITSSCVRIPVTTLMPPRLFPVDVSGSSVPDLLRLRGGTFPRHQQDPPETTPTTTC